jgi:hypothetical protein
VLVDVLVEVVPSSPEVVVPLSLTGIVVPTLVPLLLASVSTAGNAHTAATHWCSLSQSELRRHSAGRQPSASTKNATIPAVRIRTSP